MFYVKNNLFGESDIIRNLLKNKIVLWHVICLSCPVIFGGLSFLFIFLNKERLVKRSDNLTLTLNQTIYKQEYAHIDFWTTKVNFTLLL